MRPIHSIIERANAVFPNLAVELGDEQLDRSITSRRIGRYAVTHLKAPAATVELIGRRAVAHGLAYIGCPTRPATSGQKNRLSGK